MTWSEADRKRHGYSREKMREYQREWRRSKYQNDPEWREGVKRRVRKHDLKKLYGLSEEFFQIMRDDQDDRCASCGDPFVRTPHVDHCHKTGKIRGLLCGGCNRAAGLLKDDPARMRALAAYLEMHAEGGDAHERASLES